MNSAKVAIRNRLATLPEPLAPLVSVAERYLCYCSVFDLDGTALVGHMPWIAPERYAVCVYPPARTSWFAKYAKLHGGRILPSYRTILGRLNGCEAFGLSLYGMPPSMLENPPRMSRSVRQCLDIGTANKHWARPFGCGPEMFHIGSRHYTESENVGYFMASASRIISMRKNGEVVGEWSDFSSFLRQELEASMQRECGAIPTEWWH